VTRCEKAGYGIGYAAAAALAVAAPLGGVLAYYWSSESHFDFVPAAVVAFAFLVLPVAAVSFGLAVVAWRLSRSARVFEIVLWCTMMFVVVYAAGAALGGREAEQQFRCTRDLANLVVAQVEAHKTEHDRYPDALSDLRAPPPLMFRAGRRIDLEYEKTPQGGFVLRYAYGWPVCEYSSETKHWWETD